MGKGGFETRPLGITAMSWPRVVPDAILSYCRNTLEHIDSYDKAAMALPSRPGAKSGGFEFNRPISLHPIR